MAARLTRFGILATALFVAAGAAVRADDPLAQQKARRQIADQRTEYTVKEAIREADKIARVSPTRAVESLKKLSLSLDLSVEISSEKRAELVRQIDAKIRALQGGAAASVDPKAGAHREAQRKQLEAAQAETKEVREAIAEIGKLYESARIAEAQRKLGEITRKYPNNPAVLELGAIGTMTARLAQARKRVFDQDQRLNAALHDLAKSSLPPRHDMEFPADWRDKDRRKTDQFLRLGEKEQAIVDALDTVVRTGVNNAPFEETLQSLSNLIDKPIYLDKKSLEDAGLDLRRPVSVPANVTARTALRGILQSQGLTFIIKDEVIQVLTLERARQTLVTRAYYLGDVITMVGPFSGGATWGPYADAIQTQKNAEFIIQAIKKSVDPLAWDEQHGPASITFHYPSLSIIVRAPAEVHASLGGKLGPSR